jgi:hypothetical protein
MYKSSNFLIYDEPGKSDRFLGRNKVDEPFLRKSKKENKVTS